MLKPCACLLCLIVISSGALAEGMGGGKWVASDGLSCNATCGNLFPLAPGKNSEGKHYYVCAARTDDTESGMKPGFSVRATPNTCIVQSDDGFVNASAFDCFCVDTPLVEQN
jgi:hypothetical protein